MSECVFEQFNECGLKQDVLIGVEMNVDAEGKFHSHAEHKPDAIGSEPHGATQRVSGKAHLSCYKAWYEETYGSAFTMSD